MEYFTSNSNLYLLGDSILDNEQYVLPFQDVLSVIKRHHTKTFLYARDNSTIIDVYDQLSKINKNNKHDTICLSIGGNDILEDYRYHQKDDMEVLNKIKERYDDLLDYISINYKCEVVLCNVYYPISLIILPYYNILSVWNTYIENYSINKNYKLVQLDKYMNKSEYFTDIIEPSEKGSIIISNQIMKLKTN
jgi:lysophospholipase L1-like esterase